MSARPAPWDRAALGALVVTGWVARDLATFATHGEPQIVLELLAGSLGAIACGALLGLVRSWSPASVVALGLLLAAGSFLPPVVAARYGVAAIWLPRAVALILLALVAVEWLSFRRGVAILPAAFGAGVLASLALSSYQSGFDRRSLVALVVGLLIVAGGALRRHGAWLSLGVLLSALLVVGFAAYRQSRLGRPDRPAVAVAHDGHAPDLILIVLDTVAASHLAPYGYERATTPRLDDWVRSRATIYSDARSTSSWTLPSHASLFTGLFPGQHEATHTRRDPDEETVLDVRWPAQRLRDDVPTLAERLAEVGYQTAAIVSNSFYVGHEFGLDRGFEHFDDRPGSFVGHDLALVQMAGLRPRTGHLAYRDAERIGALARRWLDRKRRDRPFFLFINFMDAHWPFVPPPPFDRAFDDERPDRPLRPTRPLQALQYDRELLYLDHHVAALLDHLEQTGLVDGSLIVITSDHGEAFGEHGFHRHDKMLYEEVIKVPLYVKRPGAKSGGLSDEPVTGTDVYRMILRELGLPAPAPAAPRGMIGEWYRSQRMIRRSQAAAARGIVTADDLGPHDLDRDLIAWLDGSTKWIVSSRGAVEAYDLAADPGERRPLTPTADRIESAVARATAWWTAHPPQGTVNDEPIDEETRRRLRSLGYLD